MIWLLFNLVIIILLPKIWPFLVNILSRIKNNVYSSIYLGDYPRSVFKVSCLKSCLSFSTFICLSASFFLSFFLSFFIYFCSFRDQAQNLAHARQVLYHWATASALALHYIEYLSRSFCKRNIEVCHWNCSFVYFLQLY
jgi:hypothetical protein